MSEITVVGAVLGVLLAAIAWRLGRIYEMTVTIGQLLESRRETSPLDEHRHDHG